MAHSNTSNSLNTLCSQANREFVAKFDRAADITAIAPGRVNLIGEHIDYNDGFVLPFAIDRYTAIVGGKNNSSKINYFSIGYQQMKSVEVADVVPIENSWTNYLNGVVAGFQQMGYKIPGFDVAIHSDIPAGAGLSSSAALEVATATFLEGLLEIELDKKQKALLCQKAEHDFAGMPCGIMDQFASVFGVKNRLVLIDCQSQNVSTIALTELENLAFMITDTKAAHQLVDGEYAIRKNQSTDALRKLQECSYRNVNLEQLNNNKTQLTEVEFRRARHVITEIARTEKAAKLTAEGNWSELGKEMFQSHLSLRDDYEVSCEELDFLVEQFHAMGNAQGVLGSRMTGGGFGGCTITLVQSEKINDITNTVEDKFQKRFGQKPPSFVTTPSQGAHLITNPS